MYSVNTLLTVVNLLSPLETHGDASMIWRVQSTTDTEVAAPALGTTPTMEQEVQFMNGLNPDGTLATTDSVFLNENGESNAFKWGDPTAGTGATVSYAFDPTSNFTEAQQNTVREAFANWAAVADITFVESTDPAQASSANILLNMNGNSTAYTETNQTMAVDGALGHPDKQVFVTVDVATFSVDAPSAWRHEIGHAIGLGHGGRYDGEGSTPSSTQFGAFDDHQYTTMSYVSWLDSAARYADQNPNSGTDWGINPEGNARTYSDSIQMLDILAIQQMYGVSKATPFTEGQTYGFNTTVSGPLQATYDFAVNTLPVVTLYNQGQGNTLDLSGFGMDQRVNLNSGMFSDIGGLKNNVAVAIGTIINDAVGGSGNDSFQGNEFANALSGLDGNDIIGGGNDADILTGGAGADAFAYGSVTDSTEDLRDRITDFSQAEQDQIDLQMIDADPATEGDQAFEFVGTDGLVAGAHGQIAVVYEPEFAVISSDLDGDGTIDFSVQLDGVSEANPLTANDFRL